MIIISAITPEALPIVSTHYVPDIAGDRCMMLLGIGKEVSGRHSALVFKSISCLNANSNNTRWLDSKEKYNVMMQR